MSWQPLHLIEWPLPSSKKLSFAEQWGHPRLVDPVRFHSSNASSASSNSRSDGDQSPGDFWLHGAFIESIRHEFGCPSLMREGTECLLRSGMEVAIA